MKLGRLALLAVFVAAISLAQLPAMGDTGGTSVEVSNGSLASPFSENKQNEPALAVDPVDDQVLVAGANDNIDLEACNAGADNTCPFTQGVGVSGVYFSFDGGQSWTQPTYSGNSARDCQGSPGSSDPACTPDPSGDIGTLPWYYENGIVSDGDPALAFGPTPDSSSPSGFSYDNGSRLYYANLTSSVSTQRTDAGFKGVEAIGVSRTDISSHTLPVQSDWQPPVVVTAGGSAAGFADKEQVWADNYSDSPNFGNVYLCFGDYVGGPSAGSNAVREVVGRSIDGGDTWSTQVVHKNTSSSSGTFSFESGTSGCTIRTDSDGTVYLFWVGFDGQTKQQAIYLTRSTDGGLTYEKPHALFQVHGTGVFDPVVGRNVMDGVAGARDDLADGPSVDIANGSETSTTATDQLVLAWVDGTDGLNNETLQFSTSPDGDTWSTPVDIKSSGDRPYYAAAAISPDGSDVYVVYNNWEETFKNARTGLNNDRPLDAVILHADAADLSTVEASDFTEVFRSDPADARGSSQNNLGAEFLGDYVYVVARDAYGSAVWNDVRGSSDCDPIDRYLDSLETKSKKDDLPRPAPQQDCDPTFGNSSIYGITVADPSSSD
jgi:hypothetical protein